MGKKIKVSKNRKKTWRKYGDVQDVEDFLVEKRLQERTGGIVHEKTDKELYHIDVKPKNYTKKPLDRPFKSLTYLKPLNNFPPVTNLCQKFTQKRKRTKLINANHNYKPVKKIKKIFNDENNESDNDFNQDIWSNNKISNTKYQENIKELFDKDYAPQLRLTNIKVPVHRFLRPSKLDAVLLPHPGASYNPTYKDHQNLLGQVIEKEEKCLMVEEKILRKAKVIPINNKTLEEIKFKEMCQGLSLDADDALPASARNDKNGDMDAESDAESVEDPTETDSKVVAILTLPQVSRDKKKTRAQKRKADLHRTREKQRIAKKLGKKLLNDINGLRSLKKLIRSEELKRETKRKMKKLMKLSTEGIKTKRLGKHKFVEPGQDFMLGSEIPESLRKLKPQGHLLLDSYKSLQRRNVVEVTERRIANVDRNRLYADRKKEKGRKKTKDFVRNAFKDLI
ncbi:ribosome biogenesis protein NOP53-like isoform X2 [Gordionus sp. m RMFG-2023]|uniref:ribosome biogenesis protein NOP53-like isoform X2 n=1 Tax=Gordionus sp. m RMFG-2023 TaxID=3053472 RepID=UPI0031FC9964